MSIILGGYSVRQSYGKPVVPSQWKNWYYAYTPGALAVNTTVGGYHYLNYNGEWVLVKQVRLERKQSLFFVKI